MRKRIDLSKAVRALLLGAALTCAWPADRAAAVSTPGGGIATATNHNAFVMVAGSTSATRTYLVEGCTSVDIVVTALRADLVVKLISPTNVQYTCGTSATNFVSSIAPNQAGAGLPGAAYVMSLKTPSAGNWRVSVTSPSALTSAMDVLVDLTYNGNGIRGVLLGGSRTYRVGQTVPLALVVFNGTAKQTGLTIGATLGRLGDASFTPVPVTFLDDGSGTGGSSLLIDDGGDGGGGGGGPPPGDGMYRAQYTATQPGTYIVHADVTGFAGGYTYRRSVAASFQVVQGQAGFTGVATDRAFDTNGNGLFDAIGVSPAMTASAAGTYDVTVRLTASNGKSIQHGVSLSLPVGMSTPEVVFSVAELRAELGVNGPYTISFAGLVLETGGEPIPQDERFGMGSTAAYDLDALERPRLTLTGITGSHGVDTNGNGLYEWLDIDVGIYARDAGNGFEQSAVLYDSHGTKLEYVQKGGINLVAGQQTLTFRFTGQLIGVNGVDGPLQLKNLILTSLQSSAGLAIDLVGSTASYNANQFEGSITPDHTPPSLAVSLNPIGASSVSHDLVLVTPHIACVDDRDPSPLVHLATVYSNEGQDVTGDGHTSPDIIVNDDGTLYLRAERSGSGSGRIYHLIYVAEDHSGNSTTFDAQWAVPHDNSGPPPGRRFGMSAALLDDTPTPQWEVKWQAADPIDVPTIEFELDYPDGSAAIIFGDEGAEGDQIIAAPDAPPGTIIKVHLLSDGEEVGSETTPAPTTGEGSTRTPVVDLLHRDSGVPTRFALYQNQPNPARLKTAIPYDLPWPGMVRLEVFDTQGRRIRTLLDRARPAGRYTTEWDLADEHGGRVRPGIYMYQLQSGTRRALGRMVVLP